MFTRFIGVLVALLVVVCSIAVYRNPSGVISPGSELRRRATRPSMSLWVTSMVMAISTLRWRTIVATA